MISPTASSATRRAYLAAGALLAIVFGVYAASVASDFDVYYRAGGQVLRGDARLYPDDVGEAAAPVHYLRAAPAVAWLFAPLALLPFEAAAFIFYILKLAGLVAIVGIVSRTMNVPPSLRWRVAAGSFAATGGYIVEELRYGNAHLLVLFGVVTALYLAHRGRVVLPAVLLALAVAVKLTPLLVVVYLAIVGRMRAAVAAIAVFAGLLLLPSAIYGNDTNVRLLKTFFSSAVHVADQPRNHSLRGAALRYLTDAALDGRSYPKVNLATLPKRQALAVWAAGATGLAALLFVTVRHRTRSHLALPLKDSLVITAMLLLAPHTQRIHFSWLFYPCCVLMAMVVSGGTTRYRRAIVWVLSCAAIAGTIMPLALPSRRLSVAYEMGSPYLLVALVLFFLIAWLIWRGEEAECVQGTIVVSA